MTDDSVIIEGERIDEREEPGTSTYRYERTYGRFRREIPLPEGVKGESATATFRNGVLEIMLDIPQAGSGRREIPIQSTEATGQPESAKAGESTQTGQQATRDQPAGSGEAGQQSEQKEPGEKAA
jgi:HSP20 family protein